VEEPDRPAITACPSPETIPPTRITPPERAHRRIEAQVDKWRGIDWRIETEAETAQAWRQGFDSRRNAENDGEVPG
jgi:hypothetical protein